MPLVLTMRCYHIEKVLFAPINCVVFRFLPLGFGGFPLHGQNNIKNPTFFFIGLWKAWGCTFVLTESGLATMNLKNCGRYLRSPSPSLYNAVQTSLNIARQTYMVGQLRELNKIVPEYYYIIKRVRQDNLRVRSEFLHIMFNNEIITPSGTYRFNRRFGGIQKQ